MSDEIKKDIESGEAPDTMEFDEQYGRQMQEELREISSAEHRAEAVVREEEGAAQTDADEKEPGKEESGWRTIAKKIDPRKWRGDRPRRKKHGFLWFCILIGLVIAVVIFLNSKFFAVDKIIVKGNDKYSAHEVVKLSGATQGKNIFHMSMGKIERTLQKDTYIREADVERKLPRQLIIRVEERTAVAYLPSGQENVIIDEEGYILETVSKKPKLTKITGMKIKSKETGTIIHAQQEERLEQSIHLIQLMTKNDLFFKKISVGKVTMKAYVYDKLICKGTYENICRTLENGSLQEIIYDLYKKHTTQGTIHVGAGEYCSFSPKVEK